MSLLSRLLHRGHDRRHLLPLYAGIVAAARDPAWFRAGVPDTVDGRFDMIAALLALVLIRMEDEGGTARAETVALTELFIDDMDGSLRQFGIGDLVVGKHVGKMMGALGGRLAAFRAAAGDEAAMADAVKRNLFHEAPPSDEAVIFVARRMAAFADGLNAAPAAALLAGEVPAL